MTEAASRNAFSEVAWSPRQSAQPFPDTPGVVEEFVGEQRIDAARCRDERLDEILIIEMECKLR
jgi:hypothetical protein